MEKFDLAPAEWNIMECLWERAPQTGRELTEQLEASMGWSRSTTLTLLRRMVGKGVVTCDTEGTKNTFSPAVRREDNAQNSPFRHEFLDIFRHVLVKLSKRVETP